MPSILQNYGSNVIAETQIVLNFKNSSYHQDESTTVHCPKHILKAFQELVKRNNWEGKEYADHYRLTGGKPTITKLPEKAEDFTPIHLQILARNEKVNTDGVIKKAQYASISEDDTTLLRALVKQTVVSGIVSAKGYGGYPRGNRIIEIPQEQQKTIIIDQSGFQAQNPGNTFDMFFYPAQADQNRLRQSELMHQNLYQKPRPKFASAGNSIDAKFNSLDGKLDLNGFKEGIKVEFLQAIRAAGSQSEGLQDGEKILFRYLKAGMGFFMDGLSDKHNTSLIKSLEEGPKLEKTRLEGILSALQEINQLDSTTKVQLLGKVKAIQLPYSDSENSELKSLLNTIGEESIKAGLEWKGAGKTDALKPETGFVIATTNTGDPHAMIGNEGDYKSVDAAIACNCPTTIHRHNVAVNEKAKFEVFENELTIERSSAEAATSTSIPSLTSEPITKSNHEEELIKLIQNLSTNLGLFTARPGNWFSLNENKTLEIGKSGSGLLSISSIHHQIGIKEEDGIEKLLVFEKTAPSYTLVEDSNAREDACKRILEACRSLNVSLGEISSDVTATPAAAKATSPAPAPITAAAPTTAPTPPSSPTSAKTTTHQIALAPTPPLPAPTLPETSKQEALLIGFIEKYCEKKGLNAPGVTIRWLPEENGLEIGKSRQGLLSIAFDNYQIGIEEKSGAKTLLFLDKSAKPIAPITNDSKKKEVYENFLQKTLSEFGIEAKEQLLLSLYDQKVKTIEFAENLRWSQEFSDPGGVEFMRPIDSDNRIGLAILDCDIKFSKNDQKFAYRKKGGADQDMKFLEREDDSFKNSTLNHFIEILGNEVLKEIGSEIKLSRPTILTDVPIHSPPPVAITPAMIAAPVKEEPEKKPATTTIASPLTTEIAPHVVSAIPATATTSTSPAAGSIPTAGAGNPNPAPQHRQKPKSFLARLLRCFGSNDEKDGKFSKRQGGR